MKAYSAREWTDVDVENLRSYARRGYSSSFTAKIIRRSPGAVRFKAHKLKIRFRSNGRRK